VREHALRLAAEEQAAERAAASTAESAFFAADRRGRLICVKG
jgi:hypothetical protein